MIESYTDKVKIAVPPVDRMSRVVRMATAAVASRTGLNLDQADDLNTALDELFRLSIASDGAEHSFCVLYDIHPDRLEVLAEGVNNCLCDENSKVDRYRRFIIDKVADRFEERFNPNGGLDILLVKYIAP